ncbi:MAG: aspartate kinase [Paludibacteraceae bacterium]|nr:aspartate kinase [Paludibacteraceae bacterium]
MKVYKFGGASVATSEGISNVARIISLCEDDVLVVVSAMGKTTNALERVLDALMADDRVLAQKEWDSIVAYHDAVIDRLSLPHDTLPFRSVPSLWDKSDYDLSYDQLVSLGELISSAIVQACLLSQGIDCDRLDMTRLLRTDHTYRDARVDLAVSQALLRQALQESTKRVHVLQGFIGGTEDGLRTTLGREGSDYTAALVGNFVDAESVTIWKDVPGILNADPRLVPNTVLIPELRYSDAVELSYSGAQIIHPKTIRPLENKHIPLYVKPFGDPSAPGSKIHADAKGPIQVPVYIWRKNQVLITVRPKDFAFVLEESLNTLFEIIHRHRLKVSLIQASAVTISVSVDHTRYVAAALEELAERFTLNYNGGLSLLTIRGTTPRILEQETQGREILLSQTTRRTARLLIKEHTHT